MIAEPKPQEIFRVVVVEDNEDDRELLVRQLRKSEIEHHVKFLTDGKEALKFLRRAAAARAVLRSHRDLPRFEIAGHARA